MKKILALRHSHEIFPLTVFSMLAHLRTDGVARALGPKYADYLLGLKDDHITEAVFVCLAEFLLNQTAFTTPEKMTTIETTIRTIIERYQPQEDAVPLDLEFYQGQTEPLLSPWELNTQNQIVVLERSTTPPDSTSSPIEVTLSATLEQAGY
ncbi:hypothetical protein HN511_01305 [bacterium]|nr:hypothetical protein [bacterium]